MKENLLDFQNGSIANWNSAIDAKYYGKGTRWKPQDFEKMLSRYDVSMLDGLMNIRLMAAVEHRRACDAVRGGNDRSIP